MKKTSLDYAAALQRQSPSYGSDKISEISKLKGGESPFGSLFQRFQLLGGFSLIPFGLAVW